MNYCCKNTPSAPDDTKRNTSRFILKAILLILVCGLPYWKIETIARWLVTDVVGLNTESTLLEALIFFLYDTTKILLLLIFMVYVLAWLRAGINAEKIREKLMGINRFRAISYIASSIFGAFTPFCSCSVPLFLGFTVAGIPLGVTMSFLITSPLLNEVAVVMLWELLGWKLATIYIVTSITAGVFKGFVIDKLRADRWLQPFILESINRS